MHLYDTLQVCLLALESRHPYHQVNINKTVLRCEGLEAEGHTSQSLINFLAQAQPDLLQATAYLIIDSQRCEIFLSQLSEQVPAFIIHCRGKIHPSKDKVAPH